MWKLLDQIEALLDEGGEAAATLGRPARSAGAARDDRRLAGPGGVYGQSQADRAIAYCEEALALLPERWRYVRGGAFLYWGMGMRASGHGDAAQRILIDEYESLLEKTDTYALRLLFTVCFNSIETGHLEQARQLAQVMLEQATSGRLLLLQGCAHYFLGVVHYCWNELDAARQHFEELVDKRFAVHTQAARNGMIGLARVHAGQGRDRRSLADHGAAQPT